MARAPDAPIQTAGQVSPGVQQSVQQGKQALMQAIQSSEQQRGATTRTGMQIQGQERMQKEQQAFQEQQNDLDREARIVGAEQDRKHQEKILNLQDNLATKRMELEQEFSQEAREYNEEKMAEREKKLTALWKAEKRFDAHMSQERGKAALQVAKLNAKQRSDTTKLGIAHLRQAEEREQQRKIYDQLNTNLQSKLKESYKTAAESPEFFKRVRMKEESFNPIINQELKNQAVQSITVKDITSANKSVLETKISSGQITGDEYIKTRAVLDSHAAALKSQIGEAKTGLERAAYSEQYQDALSKSIVWRNLRDSKLPMTEGSNISVGQFVAEKVRNWEGTSFSAVMEDLVKKTGTDTDAIIGELSNIYKYEQIDIPDDVTDPDERDLLVFMNSILK
jgi:hypothetical protein